VVPFWSARQVVNRRDIGRENGRITSVGKAEFGVVTGKRLLR